jgi:hypothetical protein
MSASAAIADLLLNSLHSAGSQPAQRFRGNRHKLSGLVTGPISGHEDRIAAVLWTGMVQTMEEGRGQRKAVPQCVVDGGRHECNQHEHDLIYDYPLRCPETKSLSV